MDLEQLCLVLVPRPSDDWEDPVPQEKGSPEIDKHNLHCEIYWDYNYGTNQFVHS